MNNCKNCGARYHPDECDYCSTPQYSTRVDYKPSTPSGTNTGDQTLTNKTIGMSLTNQMLQEYMARLQYQQQQRQSSVWQAMLQGGASMLNGSSQVPWFLR